MSTSLPCAPLSVYLKDRAGEARDRSSRYMNGKRGEMGSSFRELIVWQRAIDLAVAIYELTSGFPAAERFGLTYQLRRAAVSVASNIAEGFGRATRGEYLQFLGQARGSNSEIETQLLIVRTIGMHVGHELQNAESLCADVGRLLNALMKALRSTSATTRDRSLQEPA